jgi:hypothetical protein
MKQGIHLILALMHSWAGRDLWEMNEAELMDNPERAVQEARSGNGEGGHVTVCARSTL